MAVKTAMTFLVPKPLQ